MHKQPPGYAECDGYYSASQPASFHFSVSQSDVGLALAAFLETHHVKRFVHPCRAVLRLMKLNDHALEFILCAEETVLRQGLNNDLDICYAIPTLSCPSLSLICVWRM